MRGPPIAWSLRLYQPFEVTSANRRQRKGAIMGFYSSHIEMVRPNVMMSHYGYITRKGKYANRHDFVFSESGNMPKWAKDETDYWQTVSDKEMDLEQKIREGKRREANYAVRKIIFALPNEMTEQEMIQFTRDYLEANYKDLPYTFVIHKKDSAIYGIENPHVHVIFSDYVNNERTENLDRDTYFKKHGVSKAGNEYGGAYRTRDYTARPPRAYRRARKDLADRINAYYEEKGIDKRVSEKSLEAQIKEALQQGDYLTAEILKRSKPFRLSPRKFKKYGKLIQQKVLAGWRNVKNLDDVPDPEVRNRIVQEFEKQLKEEFANYTKTFDKQPSDLDKIHAIEAKMDELQTFKKFAPNRNTHVMARNEKRLEELEKQKNWILLRVSNQSSDNYYLSKKYESEITQKYRNEEITHLMNASPEEKIKEYAIAAYSIREMHKRINTLMKEKEEVILLKKLSKRTDGEAEALKKKLESKESLLRYLEKNKKDTEDIQADIEELKTRIDDLAERVLTPEEKKEISDHFTQNCNEIYKLKEISSSYATRIKDAGIDEKFREEHKKEIFEYLKNLERLNKYDINEKAQESLSSKEGKTPSFKDERRLQAVNDAVLKRIDQFQTSLKEDMTKNWDQAYEKALNDITNGLIEKLKKENHFLTSQLKNLGAYEHEKRKSINERLAENQKDIQKVASFYRQEAEEKAREILKDWRKGRNEKVAALALLQKQLARDSHRKYLNRDIARKAKEVLKGSNWKIDYIQLRDGHSRFEEERLRQLEEGYKNENLTFMKAYNALIPHTQKYYLEQLIDEESNKQLTALKNQIREEEKKKVTLSTPDPSIDAELNRLHRQIERTIEEYRTPELMEKAKILSEASVKRWPENRAKAQKLVKKFKARIAKAHLSQKEKRRKNKILSYAKYQLSKRKLLNDTVTTRILQFKDKVLRTIPRKEDFYIHQIINERTNNELMKKESLIRHAEKIVKDLSAEYPKTTPSVMKAQAKLEALKQEKELFQKAQTTPDVIEEAKQRKQAAIDHAEVNMNALKEEYKALMKDANRKHLSPGTQKRVQRNMSMLGKMIERQRRQNQKAREMLRQSMRMFDPTSTNGLDEVENAMDKLEDMAGKGFKRANIKIYGNDGMGL